MIVLINSYCYNKRDQPRRNHGPRGVIMGSAVVRLLGWQIQTPPGARMSVSCECCVL